MPLSSPARGFVPLELAEVRRETADAVSLAFRLPSVGAERFRFRPGQYLTLRAVVGGEEVRRSYSICSGPGEALRVAIKLVDGGRFSGWAHEALRAGQALDVMAPEGRFVLPDGTGPRHVLAVAAGSGITPILAMVKAVLVSEPDAVVTLLYGSRSTGQILFREELEALKDRFMARFSVLHVLSREQTDIPVLNGRLDAAKVGALAPDLVAGGADAVLLCGPGAMIDEVTTGLVAAGMPAGRVLSERFGDGVVVRARPLPSPSTAVAAFAVATVVADGVATTVPVADGEAVLDAALRAGLDLPYSCRAGMCSTCRARVTEGTVRMAVNYGLEPWETAAGYVLTCQAQVTTGRVVVDFDAV